jgi:Putative zinc-finger
VRTTDLPGQGDDAPPDAANGAGHPPRQPASSPLDEKAPAGPSQEMAPSGETGHGSTQEDMAVNDHAPQPDASGNGSCPDLEEDVAAFLDGTLPAERRAAMVEHLASCESCNEIFAGALRFQVDEQQRVTPQAPPQRPFERADRRRRRWGEVPPRAWRRRAAPAIAALLVASLGLSLVWWRVRSAGEISTEGLSADLVKSPAALQAAMEKVPWGHTMRGSGGPGENEVPLDLGDFRLGVRLLDLRLALASGKKEQAASTLSHLESVLHAMDFLPPEIQPAFRRIASELDRDIPPAALLPKAAAEEKKLASAGVEGQFVDLGRWTEACRLSAAARQEPFFHSRATRRLLDKVEALGEGLPGSAAETLRAIKAAAGAGRIDFDTLGSRCEELLNQLDG